MAHGQERPLSSFKTETKTLVIPSTPVQLEAQKQKCQYGFGSRKHHHTHFCKERTISSPLSRRVDIGTVEEGSGHKFLVDEAPPQRSEYSAYGPESVKINEHSFFFF